MTKLLLMPALLVLGCLIAGVYGAVHDQVSFTASPDYFFAFKFHQFDIPPELQNRVGAAIVGWRATWWMGAVIGVPVVTAGLLLPGWQAYLKHSLIAFAVVALTALLVGMGALAIAGLTISKTSLPNFHFPSGVVDRVAFARVGVMHNFSYLGGFLGIATGIVYLAVARRRMISAVPSDLARSDRAVSH
jgi:hypothetical protein